MTAELVPLRVMVGLDKGSYKQGVRRPPSTGFPPSASSLYPLKPVTFCVVIDTGILAASDLLCCGHWGTLGVGPLWKAQPSKPSPEARAVWSVRFKATSAHRGGGRPLWMGIIQEDFLEEVRFQVGLKDYKYHGSGSEGRMGRG